MFILNTKLNVYLSLDEIADLKLLCASCELNINKVNVIRNKGLSWRKNIACFSVIHPDCVFICDDKKSIKALLPHIAHELKHREQYKRMGAMRYLCLANPVWRKATIEPEAYAEEKRIKLELNL